MHEVLSFDESYQDLHEGRSSLPGEVWTVAAVEGADALEWLQGQLSQDMRGFAHGQVREACLLTPTGQILAALVLGHFGDRILAFISDEGFFAFQKRVEETVFMEDVRFNPYFVPAEMFLGPRQNLNGEGRVGDIFEARPHLAVRLSDPIEHWLKRSLEERCFILPACDPDAAETVRLELGIPKWGVDFGPKTMPPELGEDFDRRHVSYDKGCWTGQEVLMRIRSRGHTNRTWRAVLAESPLEPGDLVHFGEERVGILTSSAFSPKFGHIGAAMLRNQASGPGNEVQVESAAERIPARVRAFPLLPSPSP